MVKNKAFINLTLLGLSFLLSWSLIDYFFSRPNNLNLVQASGSCEYVKWPSAELNAIPLSYSTSGAVLVTSSPIYVQGGNIGIGINNPQYKLHVNGTTSVSFLCFDGKDCRSSWPTGGGTNYWTLTSTDLYPSTSSYNVVIGGTQSAKSDQIAVKLTVYGPASISSIGTNAIKVESPSDDERGIYFVATDTNLRIYRDKNFPRWTILRNDHPKRGERGGGIGFELFPDQIDFAIFKPSGVGLQAQSSDILPDNENILPEDIFAGKESNETRVGIGTRIPKAKLDVVGNIRALGVGNSSLTSGNIISDKPWNYPYGVVIRTDSNWQGWARQFAFIGPNGERLGALIGRGTNSSTFDYLALGLGITREGKGEYDNFLTIRSNGRVGIGTNNPQYKLHVIGTTSVSALCLGTDCRSSWPRGGDDIGSSYWRLSGNNLYVSSTNWSIAIGTTSSMGKFYVDTGQGNMKFSIGQGSIGLYDSVSQNRLPYIQWIGEDNKRAMYLGWGDIANKKIDMTLDNGYSLRWNGIDEKGNSKNLMVLTNYGYLGIGTTSPQHSLDVAGNIRSSNKMITTELCLGTDCRSSWPRGGEATGTNYWRLRDNVLSPSSTNWYVGIGTDGNVTEPLFIKSNSVGKGIYLIYPNNVNLRIYQDMSTNLEGWALLRNNFGAGLALMVKNNDPSLVVKKIFSQGLGPLAATSTGGDSETIDSRVGIGTFSPMEKLHVMGNVFIQPAAGWSQGNEAKIVLGDGYNYLAVKYGSGLDVGSYHGKFTLFKTQPTATRTILEISEE